MMRIGTIDWELLLSTWGERWAWTLLHSLWQDGLLTIGLWVLLRMLAARRADLRYSAALATFALAAAAPFVTWAWLGVATNGISPDRPAPAQVAPSAAAPTPAQVPASRLSDAAASPRPLELVGMHSDHHSPVRSQAGVAGRASPVHRSVVYLVLAAWGVGVAIYLLRIIRDLSATRTLLRGDGVLSAAVQARLARVVELLQLRRRFQVVVSATQAGPFVFGLWKPTLVLPAALIAGLTPDQLEAVLLHELSHLRRYDDVINFMQLLVEAVFFFNPALRWISRELRREREASCDARAVACLSSPLPLAEALAHVAEGLTASVPVPLPALGFAKDAEPGVLLDRMHRILSPNHRPRLRLSWTALAVTILLVGVLVGGLQQATSWSIGFAKKLLSPAERIAAVAEVQKVTEAQDLGDLEAKFVVSGTIRAEDGGQLPERGTLHSWSSRESAGSSSSVGSSHNTTGDKFTVSLQPGRCWLIFSTEGYAPAIVGPLRGKGGQSLDDVEVVLKRGTSGSVRVVDQQGRPIAKANIVAAPDWGNGFWIGPSVPQATDENGFWNGEHLADVPYRISVNAAGFTPVEATESNRMTKVPLVIALEPAQPVIGIVVDQAGQPVESASFRVVAEKRGNSTNYHGDSGKMLSESRADGTFELGDLAPGTEYSMLIDAGERGHAALTNVRAGMGSIRVVLQKKLVLAGEVRGDVSELSSKGRIAIDCLSTALLTADGTVSRRMSTTLDDDGRFRFEALFPGKFQVTLGTHIISGRLDASVNDYVIDLAKLEKTFMARDVEIRFTENEKPVSPAGSATAQMEVLDGRGQPHFGGPLPIIDGVVHLRMKTPGALRLVAHGCLGYWFADFNADVPSGADTFHAQVDVLPAGAIRVKVTTPDEQSNRDGPPSASVQFRRNSPQGMRLESFSQNAVSADGVVLAPVPLETACLVSATQGFRIVHAPIMTLDGAEPVRELTLHLPKAIDAVVRVESVDGKPLPNVPIEVRYEPPAPPNRKASDELSPGAHIWGGDRQTYRNGQTILAGMPEDGKGYTVIARPKRNWQIGQTAVRTGGGVTVLKLERGHVIEGRVIDQKTGRPVPGIDVRARPSDRVLGAFGQFEAEAPTDANGNFRFSNLPAETVKLIAWGTSFPVEPEVKPGQAGSVTLKVQVAE